MTSGLLAALSIGGQCPFPVVLNGGYPTHRTSPSPPSWVNPADLQSHPVSEPMYLPWQRQKQVKVRFMDVFLVGCGALVAVLAVASVFMPKSSI